MVVLGALIVVALVSIVFVSRRTTEGGPKTGQPPPASGYFELRPVGSYADLGDDTKAAAIVHRSTWEIRPQNSRYNHTTPTDLHLQPEDPATRAYDPQWNAYVLARITGNFTGTTDEIFQWAAVKWGVPDNLLRTIAVLESDWKQSNSGDYVDRPDQCPPGYSTVPCPVTFGIVGTKSTSWTGLFPWNRDSTAAAVDALGGWLRGCYEGWVWWLRDHGNTSRGRYADGDLWGCVGAWYSGDWHDGGVGAPSGENYIDKAKNSYQTVQWLKPGY